MPRCLKIGAFLVFLLACAYLGTLSFLFLPSRHNVCDILTAPDNCTFVIVRGRLGVGSGLGAHIPGLFFGLRLGTGRLLEHNTGIRVFAPVHFCPGRDSQPQSDCHKSV